MKKVFTIIIILAAALGIYYWNINTGPREANLATYQDSELPLSFKYKTGEHGYVVEEIGPNQSAPNLVKTIVVMLKSDYDSIQRGERENGEGPPAITIQAFRNLEDIEPRAWVLNNPQLSNFPLISSEIANTTVSGIDAISYDAEGLYPSRNVVVRSGNFLYLINGSYLDRDSALYRDFPDFLKSVRIGQ